MSEQLKEILGKFGLKRQDLNCKCERQIRDRIADEIVEDWNHVGRTLDVSNSGLAKIINDNVTLPRPQDKAVRMLDVWTEEDGGKATCLKLAEALLSRKRRDVVDILCEKISNQKKKAPEAGSSGTVSSHQQDNDFECPCGNCDLLKYLDKGCPKTTSSPYPYLDPKGLSENDREDLIQRLSVDTEGIKRKFADLLFTTRESLEKRSILVSKVVCVVHDIQPDILQLDQAQTMEDAFIILTKQVMSFFNHEILGSIVEKFGHKTDKENYEKYCSELKEFCERRIVEVSPTAYSSGQTRRNRKLFAVLGFQAFIKTYTVCEVKKTKIKIATFLGLRSSQLQVEWVDISCVIIVFSISMELSQGVFPLKLATHEQLKSCGYSLFEPEQMLFEAAGRGDWQQMKSCLKKMYKQFNLNISIWEGKSLLIVAAKGGHELVLLTLLDGGADVHFIHQTTGKTALFFAAENGHHEATAILLAYGADRLQTDKNGDTPYSVAKERRHKMVCEELEAYDSRKRPSVRTVSMQQWITESIESIRDTVFGPFLPIYHWMTSDVIGATKAGDIETLTKILEQRKGDDDLIKSRESDKHAWTALMIACDRGNYKIVDLLLDKGVNPNEAAKSNGWSSLMLASRRGYLRIVKTLLDHGASPDQKNNAGITSLAIAVYERRTAVALLLLHRGAEVNLPDENGWTSLIRASSEGNLKLVKVISDLGGDVNGQTEEGWSSPMVASHYGHTDVVRELAKRGADFNLSTSAGDTAVHIATLRKNRDVVEELATLGADLDISNKDGLTALMVAANKGYNEVVDALLEGGANVHYRHPKTKWTAIFFAAKNGYVDIYNTLVEYGAKTEVMDKDGTTLSVVSVASHLKQTSILDILRKSMDIIPVPNKSESEKCDNNIKMMDSLFIALESRIKSTLSLSI